MQKLAPIFKFLNKPPRWLALLFWFYPFVWYLVCCPLTAILEQAMTKRAILYYLLVGFPLPILFLLVTSKWFLARILLVVPFWFVTVSIVFGMTQGAVTAGITNAFSVVTAGPIEIQK